MPTEARREANAFIAYSIEKSMVTAENSRKNIVMAVEFWQNFLCPGAKFPKKSFAPAEKVLPGAKKNSSPHSKTFLLTFSNFLKRTLNQSVL